MVTKHAWRLWAKALGEKSGTTDAEADRVAMLHTLCVYRLDCAYTQSKC